eukprot:SAG25_NODE_366_length_9120_cov_2.274138_6_plen_175_part_00
MDPGSSRSAIDYAHQFTVRAAAVESGGASTVSEWTLCAESAALRKMWLERLYLVTLPSKAGRLEKQSDHIGQWRSRYLRLEFGKLLYWETEQQSHSSLPKGLLELQGGSVTQRPAADDGQHRFVLEVEGVAPAADGGTARSYVLSVPTSSGVPPSPPSLPALICARRRRPTRYY